MFHMNLECDELYQMAHLKIGFNSRKVAGNTSKFHALGLLKNGICFKSVEKGKQLVFNIYVYA